MDRQCKILKWGALQHVYMHIPVFEYYLPIIAEWR